MLICNNPPFTYLLVEIRSACTKVNITVYLCHQSEWEEKQLYCKSHACNITLQYTIYFWLLLQIMWDINMLFQTIWQTAFILSCTDLSFDADNKVIHDWGGIPTTRMRVPKHSASPWRSSLLRIWKVCASLSSMDFCQPIFQTRSGRLPLPVWNNLYVPQRCLLM